METLVVLLEAGADPLLADSDGQRPVDLARSQQPVFMVHRLSSGEEPVTADLITLMLEAIRAGRTLTVGSEEISSGYAHADAVFFTHWHPAYSRHQGFQIRSQAWVAERLGWLSLHRPEAMCHFLSALAPSLGDALPPEQLVSRLEAQQPALMAQARTPLDGLDLAAFFVQALWAGACLMESNKEGQEVWRREGAVLIKEMSSHGGSRQEIYTGPETMQSWSCWGEIHDGLVCRTARSFSGALDAALTALGHATLRCYLAAQGDAPPTS